MTGIRVVVIGTAGAGKSTFAKTLAAALACDCIELDRLYWGPGWVPVPPERFEHSVRVATEGMRWVVDGNYSMIRGLLWARATHIVWLDFSRRVVYWRVLARTVRRIVSRERLSHGNVESFRSAFLSKESILLWAVSSFARNRATFSALRTDAANAHLQWTRITQPAGTTASIASISGGIDTPEM